MISVRSGVHRYDAVEYPASCQNYDLGTTIFPELRKSKAIQKIQAFLGSRVFSYSLIWEQLLDPAAPTPPSPPPPSPPLKLAEEVGCVRRQLILLYTL